ncbi:hypothetical protein J5N97_022094 [Dioscorea zingiberensis]|uniref:Uncharacterized protein n=1 Tax=Dioscorea zingiberensis TaxID=325984 RepID=A0A9D5C9V7_9LILI|nr:hypothetical protein J5N97_022094 [Dioscorea zingiberensis]
MRGADQQSRLLYELCALLFTVLRSPTPFPSPAPRHPVSRRRHVSPVGFVSLLLGASMALMLCGSVTFVIGFILMPWVLGFVMVLYLVGIVSNLSGFGKVFPCSSPEEIDGISGKEMQDFSQTHTYFNASKMWRH